MVLVAFVSAKSPIWGNSMLDHRGTLVLDFCTANDLHIVNNPDSEPTFRNVRGETWIDLMLMRLNKESPIDSDINTSLRFSVLHYMVQC